jgi:hypothetical protein
MCPCFHRLTWSIEWMPGVSGVAIHINGCAVSTLMGVPEWGMAWSTQTPQIVGITL